ncbi:MAG: Ig-like domain repeat protein, partial [Acidobacteriia bacterium]|nr:Ig-like domain repeat protein [Terriglobia bacterium]
MAVFPGDLKVAAPGTSNTWIETINSITPTTLALTTSGSPSTWGQAVTLTATITPAAAAGTVVFYDGATQLGSMALSGGSASLTTAQLAVGSHTLTAGYSANAGYGASTSPAITQTVNKASTSIVLSSSLNPATTGQSVAFAAIVTPSAATGSVQFMDGASLLATVQMTGATASFASTTLSAGSHSITAVYSGDTNCNPVTSAVLTETVTKTPSTTVLSANTATSVYGQSVLFTTAVTPAFATGTVDIMDGATVLITLPVNGPISVLNTTTLAVGTHTVTAVFSGDATYAGSTSAAATVTVSKAATTMALSSSVNPAASGQPVVFSVALAPITATGNVQFLDGATVIGTVATVFGTASFSTAGLAAGSHSITVVYAGDANCNAVTSAAITQTVTKAPSTTSLSASSGTIVFGQSVSLTASVAPVSATGTVQFLDGATPIGTAALSGGRASLTAANLAAGVHSITVVYGGDAGTGGSTSSPVTVSVSKAGASVSPGSSLNPSVAGQTVILTATVTPAAATGNAQFLDGATVIGTAALSGGAAALSTAALAAGSHSITAVYGGDANYNGATSSVLAQTVKAVTTTTLSANKTAAVAGQTVTFTATVAPAAAAGNVQFLDGATAIGTVALSGGSAVLAVSNLAVGSHSVTASYGGAAGYAASASSPVSVTIAAAPPSKLVATAASSSQINLTWTASATSGVSYNVYASATAGFTPSTANRIASGVTVTSYADTALPPSTKRYYVVTAQNANIESAASNQASATTQAAVSCKVHYTVPTQWNVGFTAAITIKNTGPAPIDGWQLTWTWPGNQQITQAWNSNFSQTGKNATLTNASWNGTIAAGTTLSGVGFNASYSGSNNNPAAFYLNGTQCQ